MQEPAYRITAAARDLDISLHHMRRLCEAGLVEAERTEGGHWRIPMVELEKLKRQGVPPIPAPEPVEPAAAQPAADLDEPPAPEPLQEDPEVRAERVKRHAMSNRLARRKTELELAEVEDRFRDREHQAQAQAKEEQRKRAEADAQSAREKWERTWIEAVPSYLPYGCPAECRLKAVEEVRKSLRNFGPSDSTPFLRGIVTAAVEVALKPHRLQERRKAAVEGAIRELPYLAQGSDSAYELAARKLATKAIDELGESDQRTMTAAATLAVQPVIRFYQLGEKRKSLVRDLTYWEYWRAEQKERESLIAEVQGTLDALPPDTAEAALEQAAKTAVAKHEAKLAAREAADREAREAQETVNAGLSCLDAVLGEYEWDSYTERVQVREQLRPALNEALKEGVEGGAVDAASVREWVESWVDENLTDDEAIGDD